MNTKTIFRMIAIGFTWLALLAWQGTNAIAQQICGSSNSGPLGNNNQYVFLGDQWNSSFTYVDQCVQITNSTTPPPTSLSDTPAGPSSNYVSGTFDNTTDTPSDYPDFLYGAFQGNSTSNTQLPMAVTNITGSNPKYNVLSGENVVEPSGYNNDMAYDIWFNTYAGTPTGQNTTGTELMIWVQHNGGAGTISGGPTYSFTDPTTGQNWTAYTGTNTGNCGCSGTGSQVISFVRNNSDGPTPAGGLTEALNLDDFFTEALNVGQIQSSWYLTAVEFGTEIWVGGPGLEVNNFWVNVVPNVSTTPEAPYPSSAAAIPGTVLAENYDSGGQGVSYNVTSTNGTDNGYRPQGVDLETATAPATANDLGWSAAGQWFKYTVNVSTAGTYKVSFLVASESAITDAFHISNSAGANLSGSVAVPDTGGWQTWQTVTATVALPAGQQTLTLNEDAAGWNIDSLAFALATVAGGPYGGTPAGIPGTVQAENYDLGGQGVGYNVTSTNGTDNAYRSDGVDLETATAPATGNDLGWSASGQWFHYTVDVTTAGTYKVSFLVASESAITDAFHMSNSSGANLSGSVAVPDTGGWQTWTTVTANVTLPAGVQTLTLNEDAAGWNIDSLAFASTTNGGGGATLTTGTPFNIVNENSGLCIGASGQGTANGTVLQMNTCASGTYSTQLSQEWIFTSASSGYYEVADANATTESWNVVNVGTTNGSLMQIWDYGAASNEEFQAVSLGSVYYKFVGQGSGLCLDVPGNSTATGLQLDIYTCNGTTAQAFKLVTP